MPKKFTKDSKLSEILKLNKGEEILVKFGVPCPTCPFFASEAEKLTLSDVCNMYGLDVEPILKELNKQE